jgi:hypothetical protein
MTTTALVHSVLGIRCGIDRSADLLRAQSCGPKGLDFPLSRSDSWQIRTYAGGKVAPSRHLVPLGVSYV